jgi:hypothetical protein
VARAAMLSSRQSSPDRDKPGSWRVAKEGSWRSDFIRQNRRAAINAGTEVIRQSCLPAFEGPPHRLHNLFMGAAGHSPCSQFCVSPGRGSRSVLVVIDGIRIRAPINALPECLSDGYPIRQRKRHKLLNKVIGLHDF